MELSIEQALEQGVAAHREGRLQDAERLYRAILQSQPDHPDANHNLGILAISVNKTGVALPLFKAALEANPEIEQFWFSYIDALMKVRKFDAAKQALKKLKQRGTTGEKLDVLEKRLGLSVQTPESALSEQKESPILSKERKKSVENKKKLKKQKFKVINPSQLEVKNLLELYYNRRFDEAEKLSLSMTQKFPKHPFGWKMLGAVLKQNGRVIDSVTAMQKSVQLEPRDAEAHSNLGATFQELERFDEAESSYKVAITLKPDFFRAHYNLGITLYGLGRLDEAEASYNQAIALKSDSAEAHSNLGITLHGLGRLDEAEASYRKAIELVADYAGAHSNLGITLHGLGRLDEAEESYQRAIALQPDYAEAHYNLGITLQEQERFEEAEVSYNQAIALIPSYAEAHNNLGVVLQELGRFVESKASYNKAIELVPDKAEAHNNLGITLHGLGRLNEAEASYNQAIVLMPDYAEAHSSLGVTLQELGRLVEAEASYNRAISLKSDYAEAHSNLGVLLFESRRYNQAAKNFELSGTHLSKLYAIQCFFLQNDASLFYEKYDLLVSQGETNAVLGSLGFRSEFKYGTKKINPFCNHPFKYVVNIDLNNQYDFKKIFIESAKEVLSDSTVTYKSQGHLTNGVQTAGNIFVQGKMPATGIETIIRAELEKYRIKYEDSEEGFIKEWPTFYEIKGWLIRMQSGGKLAPHIHPQGWITGSVYINVPPKLKNDSGNLVLCLSDEDHTLGIEKNQHSIIDVVTGSLCLFPSSLHHYTIPFEGNEDRIVLAFDVIPKNQRNDAVNHSR